VELALAGGLVGLGGGQGLDRHQYVEVGGGGAHHQVVAGGGQVLVGGGAERALGAQGGEVAPVEQRLRSAQAVAAGGPFDGAGTAIALGARAGEAGGAVDLRQQRRARLDPAFLGDEGVRFGDRQRRVAVAGHFVGLQQVGGAGG